MTAIVHDSREQLSTRLLKAAAKNSYDPTVDIDWAAELSQDKAFMPYLRVSLYGTQLWDEMSEDQRRELSKQELASIAGTGLWFEMILIQMLTRWAYHQDPQAPHTQFALTEIGDETRHIIMFAKAISRLGAPTYRPPAPIHHLARVYKALAKGVTVFAPVLVAEEMTDRLQRSIMNDEDVEPLVRMVNRIHVVEESRHVRFARDEVARQMPRLGPLSTVVASTISALVSAFVAGSLINPDVYVQVGLDKRRAIREARNNPYNHETKRWMAEKIMAFLGEQGLLTWSARPIYKFAHLI
ncbi:MAG: diiron oxygenase [Jatrophihabitantaceae bacterium]